MIATERLSVKLHGEVVGYLDWMQRDDRCVFSLTDDYLANQNRPTLSLSFYEKPGVVRRRHRSFGAVAMPFFSNLLPEGPLRKYLAQQAGIKNDQRDYPLLKLLGSDLPGAVEIEPLNHVGSASGSELQEELASVHEETMRFSLAGVQLKLSAMAAMDGGLTVPVRGVGGNWIAKFPSAIYERVPENEYSMMSLAKMIGIQVPEFRLIPTSEISGIPDGWREAGKSNSLAVKRFDRTEHGKVHTEDFAQVFDVHPHNKYRGGISYLGIAQRLKLETGVIDDFVQRLVFCALIGNGDAHLKNWSLIYLDRKNPTLSPTYDQLCTTAYLPADTTMALSLGKVRAWKDLHVSAFRRLAKACDCDESHIVQTVKETVSSFIDVWQTKRKNLPLDRSVELAIESQLRTVPFVGA